MQFTHPLFLFGLLAILIPIFIHLFNFRRYKTVYFSNVKLLQNILQKTRKESQIQHFIVLLLRVLGIAAIVFALTQPYIPNPAQPKHGTQRVAIYVDNSFSMGANAQDGNMLLEATQAAEEIVKAFTFDDEFVLITNDFSGANAKVMNKNEMLNAVEKITLSAKHRSVEELIEVKESIAKHAKSDHGLNYYISDFQENNISFEPILADTTGKNYLYKVPSQQVSNVSIDSCWFSAPLFRAGYAATLHVKVSNYSPEDIARLPIKLYVNGAQKALSAVDIKANSQATVTMNYTIGEEQYQAAELKIDDFPITFDDVLYFTYKVLPTTRILAINETESSPYLKALFGEDSTFYYEEMNVNKINYSQFKDFQIIILDQITTLSTGLQSELIQAVEAGVTMMVFPTEKMEVAGMNNFLQQLNSATFNPLEKNNIKVGAINMESRYFASSLEATPQQSTLPNVFQYFPITTASNSEVLMRLENQSPFLSISRIKMGNVALMAVPFHEDYSDAYKNAIAVLAVHNVALMSQQPQNLYHTIGEENVYVLPRVANKVREIVSIIKQPNKEEMIPEQRKQHGDVILYLNNNEQGAGFYNIDNKGELLGTIASNYSREESNLTYYSDEELATLAKQNEDQISIVAPSQNLTENVESQLSGKALWKYFIYAALLAFLLEILVLRFGRFFSKS